MTVPFWVLYVVAGVTDILDGFLARRWGVESRFGARLDSVADFVFVLAVGYKLFPWLKLPAALWMMIGLIALVKIVNAVSSYVVNHKVEFLHAKANKLTGFLLFLGVMAIGQSSFVLPLHGRLLASPFSQPYRKVISFEEDRLLENNEIIEQDVFHRNIHCHLHILDHRHLASHCHQDGVLLGYTPLDCVFASRLGGHRGSFVYREHSHLSRCGRVRSLGPMGNR